ncbi:hypothetical protein FIC_01096 [Flavobacteriaceae bacterium 3519-10]|nr:hypothetical protein FIC_01096 [Flavobacteriaceae bacterium 3519-10]
MLPCLDSGLKLINFILVIVLFSGEFTQQIEKSQSSGKNGDLIQLRNDQKV